MQKLPRLSSHLDLYGIDITLITFNWFVTLFIDAMPTEVPVLYPSMACLNMCHLTVSASYSGLLLTGGA